jgi:YHS domain-containing protein
MLKMKRGTQFLIIVGLITVMIETSAQSTLTFVGEDNVALAGYDVVNYFTNNEAKVGSSAHALKHDGANYYFASEEHKNMFRNNPDKFLPAYGGYCAFAMGMNNATVPSNPGTFKIVDGKLYVFFNDLYEGEKFNTLVPWNEDEANIKNMADTNWQAMN